MRFRLVTQVVVIVATWATVAAAAPPPGKVEDLVKMGRSLLDERAEKPAHRHHRKASKPETPVEPHDEEVKAPEVAPQQQKPPPPQQQPSPPSQQPPPQQQQPPPPPVPAPKVPAVTAPPRVSAPEDRSGRNYPMQGVMQSPLARLGIPLKAVPAVATVATIGMMALWPFLLKTLSVLLKGLLGAHLKKRAKTGKKIEQHQRQFVLFGFRLRPAELISLFLGAAVYGLAVCYTLNGWKLDSSFVLRQETLVLAIYCFRSFIRFSYERMFGLVTQFQFWPGGSLLCLGSAYLGNALATVGYELEAAKGPEAAQRVIKLKAWLLIITLLMAIGFFIANWINPQKALQSARLITSGMALAEVMPISPMPGLAIYKWRRGVWALLFALVVPTFFLINFFL